MAAEPNFPLETLKMSDGFLDWDPVRKNSMKTGIVRLFLLSAGILLSINGVAKIWSSIGNVKILQIPDPLFGIEYHYLLMMVGVIEVCVAIVCFGKKWQELSVRLVAWIATSFFLYRIALWWMHVAKPCHCLGNITDTLGIDPQVAEGILKGTIAFLLIGSYGILFGRLLCGRWKEQPGEPRKSEAC